MTTAAAVAFVSDRVLNPWFMAADPGLSWTFVVIGVAMQGFALLLARPTIRLLRAGGRTSGTVLDSGESMVEVPRGGAQQFYFPEVSFMTTQGQRITFRSSLGQRRALAKGSVVRVLFDPAKPHDAEMATFRALWLFPTVTAVFGLPFLAAGVIGLR